MERILVNKLGFERCKAAPQFYWSSLRLVALELHVDDIHGTATPSGRKQFIKGLSRKIEFKGGDGRELGKPYEHLKRLRMPMTDETRIQPNTKYLEAVSYHLGQTGAMTTDDWCVVMTHRPTMDATPLLTANDIRLYRSFVGAFMYHMLNRADAQLEVSSLASYLRAPPLERWKRCGER